MAVWEHREPEIDWLIDRYMYSRVRFAAESARWRNASANDWEAPDFFPAMELFSYHRWIARRLLFMSKRDVSNHERALTVVSEIADRYGDFLIEYGWGYEDLNKATADQIARKAEVRAEPKVGGWWDRTFNA